MQVYNSQLNRSSPSTYSDASEIDTPVSSSRDINLIRDKTTIDSTSGSAIQQPEGSSTFLPSVPSNPISESLDHSTTSSARNPSHKLATTIPHLGIDFPIMLNLENVAVSYHNVPAVEGVNLAIYEHQITSFIGPSGCGKSTILSCINRLNELVPGTKVTGQITLKGQSIYAVPGGVIRQRIGMVFQRPNPFPRSIYDNIAIGLKVNGFQGDTDAIVEKSLQQVGLWDEVKDNLRKNALLLSGGQQQRLCIARAVALEPEVLLMDEPCAFLDPISTNRINELMQSLKQKYTLIVVTHDLQQAASISDHVAFFQTYLQGKYRIGQLVEYAPTEILFFTPSNPATEEYIHSGFRLDTALIRSKQRSFSETLV